MSDNERETLGFQDERSLKREVLRALRWNPMCFSDLCEHFGVSTEPGANGAYPQEYLRLLNAVSDFQSRIHWGGDISPGPRIATAIKPGEKDFRRSFVLYLKDEERRLEDWGLRKPRVAEDDGEGVIRTLFAPRPKKHPYSSRKR